MKKFEYPPELRIKKTAEFRRVFDAQYRSADHLLVVFVLPNDLDICRLGLSVSRKHGSAVRRVEKKRLLREAFRLEQHCLDRGWDLVVVPRAARTGTLVDYRRSFVQQARKAIRKHSRMHASRSAEFGS